MRAFGRVIAAVLATTFGKVIAVSAAGLLGTVVGIMYTAVHEDELVIVSSFGRVVDGPLDPGIYWYMPYFNTIRRYPTTRQFLLVTDKSVGHNQSTTEALVQDAISIYTKDDVPLGVVLEVSYRIDKNPSTVRSFVREFGRADSEYGTSKIEKLLADACRNAARSTIGNSSLKEIETDHDQIAAEVLQKAMAGLATPGSAPGTDLGSLGVSIVTLGYRVSINDDVAESRTRGAIERQAAELRDKTNEALANADRMNLERNAELLPLRLEEARSEREVFEASADFSTRMLVLKVLDKWDGRLPQIVLIDENAAALLSGLADRAANVPDPTVGTTSQQSGGE